MSLSGLETSQFCWTFSLSFWLSLAAISVLALLVFKSSRIFLMRNWLGLLVGITSVLSIICLAFILLSSTRESLNANIAAILPYILTFVGTVVLVATLMATQKNNVQQFYCQLQKEQREIVERLEGEFKRVDTRYISQTHSCKEAKFFEAVHADFNNLLKIVRDAKFCGSYDEDLWKWAAENYEHWQNGPDEVEKPYLPAVKECQRQVLADQYGLTKEKYIDLHQDNETNQQTKVRELICAEHRALNYYLIHFGVTLRFLYTECDVIGRNEIAKHILLLLYSQMSHYQYVSTHELISTYPEFREYYQKLSKTK